MTLGNKIKYLRQQSALTLDELGKKLGVSGQTVFKYENGLIENLSINKIALMAKIFQVSPAYLMGWKEPQTPHKAVKIPVLGNVAAGIPIEAIEDVLDWEEIPQELANTGTFFALKIKGDSMSPRILNGDVVIVRQQSTANSGDIVIAKVNGYDACCKKLIIKDDGLILQSFNQAYEPMYFSRKEIEERPVLILGKVIELRGKL